jgi:hypothetical protein
MNVLALDLATHCGWALRSGDRIESGVEDFSPRRGESPGMRYVMFRKWLERIGAGINIIVYEQNFRRGGHATEVAAGFSTRVQEFCAERKIEYTTVNAMTLKKWATGSGKSDKAAMIAAACKIVSNKYVETVSLDDNQADAILILRYAELEIVGRAA